LTCESLREIAKTIGTILIGYSGTGGETDSLKKQEAKKTKTGDTVSFSVVEGNEVF
jgi:hypothetical protein